MRSTTDDNEDGDEYYNRYDKIRKTFSSEFSTGKK